jgi:subtilase family serine protease
MGNFDSKSLTIHDDQADMDPCYGGRQMACLSGAAVTQARACGERQAEDRETMSRTKKFISVIGATATVVGVCVVGAGGAAGASSVPRGDVALRGSVAPFVAHTRATGVVAGSTRLTVQVWLRPRVAAAERFATAVSTPGSPVFRHFLSPAGYAARFGATARAAGKVESWLRSKGFAGVHTDAGRDYVRATAATSKIDAAFGTELKLYRASAQANAGRYPLRANDRPVHVPRSLAGSVLGVTGLDNALPILPLDRPSTRPAGSTSAPGFKVRCSHYYAQHEVSGLPEQFGTTTFPSEVCGYSGAQLRDAYRASTADTGTGQTIALVELGLAPDMFLTLKDYARANGVPAPSPSRYREVSLGQGSDCGDPFDIEEQIDVESSYDMAPGVNQVVVGGDSCNNGDEGLQGLFDADLAVINGGNGHPLASLASNSWGSGGENQPGFLTSIENAYLVRAAGEGVGMYFSSSDGSGNAMPASDPFTTAVGGTTLGLGKTGNRLFETGWSTGISLLEPHRWLLLGEQGAAGGGPSQLWKEPSYQFGVVPPALTKAPGNRGGNVRSVPDISADADPYTGMAVGLLVTSRKHPAPRYVQEDFGGTSVASPLVAGTVAAAQQGQSKPFGFLNPALYRLAGTSAVFDALPLTGKSPAVDRGTACPARVCGLPALTTFDDQSRNMFGYTGQVTLKGYDNMSGIGTPDGPNFIKDLRALH